MQKVLILLLAMIVGNIFAGKKDRVMQGSMHTVIDKYNLFMVHENERIDEKQEQSSSSESSPSSIVAISPTNVGDEQQLSLPEEIYLATPEARRAQSPIQAPDYGSYYCEWPGSGNILGRSSGLPVDFKTSYDVYYYSAHADCP